LCAITLINMKGKITYPSSAVTSTRKNTKTHTIFIFEL